MAQTINVDISTRGAPPVAYAHQGDTDRTFLVNVFENGAAFGVAGFTVKVAAILPSDNGYTVITGADMVSATKTNTGTNQLMFTPSAQYTARSGRGILTLIMTTNTGTPATIRPINIDFRIQKSADGPDVIAGASDFPEGLEEIAEQVFQEYLSTYLPPVAPSSSAAANKAADAKLTGEALDDLKSDLANYGEYVVGLQNALLSATKTKGKSINPDGSISNNTLTSYETITGLESGTYTLFYQNNTGGSTTFRIHEYTSADTWTRQVLYRTETEANIKTVTFSINNPIIKVSHNNDLVLLALIHGDETVMDKLSKFPSEADIISFINEGYVNTNYIWESGKISNGADAADNTRIRTVGFYTTQNETVVYPNDGYQLYVVYYNSDKTFTGQHSAWIENPYTILKDYPFYRMIMRKTDQSVITTSESNNAISIIPLSVLSIDDLDVKNTVVNTTLYNGASFTFIGDLLYVFAYSNNDDYTASTNNYRYRYSPVNNTLETLDRITSNLGHQNTVDYNEYTDYLISASGGKSSNVMPSEIFLFPNASTRTSFDVTSSDVIRINVSSLDWGKQLNCIWGDTNYNEHNIIYCITNYEAGNMASYGQSHPNNFTGESKRFIRRVLLGKGSNELENGTFNSSAESDEFNGTFKVLNLWELDFSSDDAINDACFYDGRIYENVVKSGSGQFYIVHEFNDFGQTVHTEKIEIPVYQSDGQPLEVEGQGIAIKYGRLFIGASQVNIYNQWRKI